MAMNFGQWARSLTAFEKWIGAANSTARKAWLRKLNSDRDEHVQSAVAEAVAWDYIASRCESSQLNDTPGTGGADFKFVAGGRSFLVEVTNISTEAASAASGMPDTDLFSGSYSLLTKTIRQKVRNKLEQAREQSKHPLLIFVTTLHKNASSACVDRTAVEFAMASPPKITGKFNSMTGEVEGNLYQSTDLAQSVFLTPQLVLGPDGSPMAQAKWQPISGFLLGGFGVNPTDVRVYGALNPEASRPFDPTILRDVPFCSFREWPASKGIAFDWTISENDERE
jgi:hypothetical protein